MTEMPREITVGEPSFSLILCTYGPATHLPRLLESLRCQHQVDFELVVIDQNPDDRLSDLLHTHGRHIKIRHIRARPGLSSARNIGMQAARGGIIAFPDDDCWYPAGHLAAVQRLLSQDDWDGLTCRCSDEHGQLAAGAEDRRQGRVTKWNVWGRGVSATLFLKRHVVSRVGCFDETLGLGARSEFQSGEETDYLLRAIEAGMDVQYEPAMSVYHPLPLASRSASAVSKAWYYGLGMGRVLSKHEYNLAQVYWFLAVPVLGALRALCFGDPALARVRATRALARYYGWRWRPERPAVSPPWPLT